ncbi:hypothetical protein [Legionella brunensis]
MEYGLIAALIATAILTGALNTRQQML